MPALRCTHGLHVFDKHPQHRALLTFRNIAAALRCIQQRQAVSWGVADRFTQAEPAIAFAPMVPDGTPYPICILPIDHGDPGSLARQCVINSRQMRAWVIDRLRRHITGASLVNQKPIDMVLRPWAQALASTLSCHQAIPASTAEHRRNSGRHGRYRPHRRHADACAIPRAGPGHQWPWFARVGICNPHPCRSYCDPELDPADPTAGGLLAGRQYGYRQDMLILPRCGSASVSSSQLAAELVSVARLLLRKESQPQGPRKDAGEVDRLRASQPHRGLKQITAQVRARSQRTVSASLDLRDKAGSGGMLLSNIVFSPARPGSRALCAV